MHAWFISMQIVNKVGRFEFGAGEWVVVNYLFNNPTSIRFYKSNFVCFVIEGPGIFFVFFYTFSFNR